MKSLWQFLKFLRLAAETYRLALSHNGPVRGAIARNEVCYMTVYVAIDRAAWELDSKMDEVLLDQEENTGGSAETAAAGKD